MSDSPSPDDVTELLQLATTKPEYRETFLRQLLASNVLVLATSKRMADSTFHVQGQSFLLKDEHSQLEFKEIQGRRGSVVPMWTNLEALENDLHRMKMGQQSYLAIPCIQFFEAVGPRAVVLNPGTAAREFAAEQVQALLQRALRSAVASTPTQQRPAAEPAVPVTPEAQSAEATQPVPSKVSSTPAGDSSSGADPALQEPTLTVDARFESDFHHFLAAQSGAGTAVAIEAEVDSAPANAAPVDAGELPGSTSTNMLTEIPHAVAIMNALLRGRSDEAWSLLADRGDSENMARALAALLFTAIDERADDAGEASAFLSGLENSWADTVEWARQQNGLKPVEHTTMKALSEEMCGCGHSAHRHGKYSWAFRDFGIQTESPCDSRLCICEAFFTDDEI